MKKYELIVIGSGPAGEKAAVKAAYFGHRVALIEKELLFGGAEIVTGTIPSKTLKETALYFSGKYEKGLYGVERTLQHSASITDFMYRKNLVVSHAAEEVRENLYRHNVDIYPGVGSFEDLHTVCVTNGSHTEYLEGDFILIATGSIPFHPPHMPFDGKRCHDSDTILKIRSIPKSLCLVGAGVIGCEYATIFATMGTRVFLINDKSELLPHIDQEIIKELTRQMREAGIHILFNTSPRSFTIPAQEKGTLSIELDSGDFLQVDMFLFAAGRIGNTAPLKLEKIGLKVNEKQQISVDKTYATSIPHIYAVGDVIGFPSLASTSMDQGRVAVAHIFQTQDLQHLPFHFPFGIYTIPEISTVGINEEEAKKQNLDYGIGKSFYNRIVRGKIMGATQGFLKIVFLKKDLKILGVHIIGHIATELIHFGLNLVEEKRNLYDVIGTVFNFPTLHDLYKYAAYDGLSRSASSVEKSSHENS
jgi:NAD(P) transhydrogenase